jgi:asparagine synthase (glutamine-hydrolysing)
MCGIAASIDLRGESRAAAWAVDLLRHRGPDGEGEWRSPDGNAVLEHTRLAIIDPQNRESDQPFTDASGRWALTYNGEIFNYKEIRAALEREGAVFRTRSDTEVLLQGLMRWGRDLLPRLRGMFAFVLFDRETGETLAARDHLGVKPLYFLEDEGVIAFCSELRPLLAYPGFRPILDPEGVVEFLAFGKNASARTIISGINKLLPGERLEINDGRLDVAEFWDLLPPDPTSTVKNVETNEVVSRLEEAVGYSLVSDVPVGLTLSGGLDSSLVAGLAARQHDPAALTAFSVAFGETDD